MYFDNIIKRYKEEIDIVNALLKNWNQIKGILTPIFILGVFTKFQNMFTSFKGIAYAIVFMNILIVTYFIFINIFTVNIFIKKYNKKFKTKISKISYFYFIESFIDKFFFSTERTQESIEKINNNQMKSIREIVDNKQIELMNNFLLEEKIDTSEKIQLINNKIKRWKIRDFIDPSTLIGSVIGIIPVLNMEWKDIAILILVVLFVIGFFCWEYHYTFKKQINFYRNIISPFRGLKGLRRMEDLLLYFTIHSFNKERRNRYDKKRNFKRNYRKT